VAGGEQVGSIGEGLARVRRHGGEDVGFLGVVGGVAVAWGEHVACRDDSLLVPGLPVIEDLGLTDRPFVCVGGAGVGLVQSAVDRRRGAIRMRQGPLEVGSGVVLLPREALMSRRLDDVHRLLGRLHVGIGAVVREHPRHEADIVETLHAQRLHRVHRRVVRVVGEEERRQGRDGMGDRHTTHSVGVPQERLRVAAALPGTRPEAVPRVERRRILFHELTGFEVQIGQVVPVVRVPVETAGAPQCVCVGSAQELCRCGWRRARQHLGLVGVPGRRVRHLVEDEDGPGRRLVRAHHVIGERSHDLVVFRRVRALVERRHGHLVAPHEGHRAARPRQGPGVDQVLGGTEHLELLSHT